MIIRAVQVRVRAIPYLGTLPYGTFILIADSGRHSVIEDKDKLFSVRRTYTLPRFQPRKLKKIWEIVVDDWVLMMGPSRADGWAAS